ncbi:MAG: DNA methyltransferase [Chloroflexi bacterium AL-W]|nr:DNA methyltransferase [Chloroflexi bacterium AL-N1]NOK65987.1 DNA methyltransferase [Chloroflexi bacterium AL-N10]NOK72868.1 DNA methyltransferase [Chloroflexi bacterium AL-N5]NOK79765.1 DNA methyltransferase [Chloroflexi bacterium AL-W]NOK88379.1 DNA methyltransferase [Chloroflexi bacterium AL-N15]
MLNEMPMDLPDADDDASGANGEILHIYTLLLVEATQQLRDVASMDILRNEVFELKQHLLDPDSHFQGVAETDETTPFPPDYLCDELDQISASQSLERARYYIERFLKSITEVRTNAVNDINLNSWKKYDDIYTDSLWVIDRRDSSGVHTAGYWGNFIPQIPSQMIRRYTKHGDWVIDTFAGSGTTLIEAQRWGRHSIGVELQPNIADHARALIAAEPNEDGVTSDIVNGDCTTINYPKLLEQYQQSSAQLVIMHPPYFDIIKFSDDARDLSNASSVEHFLAMIGQAVDNVTTVLDPKRYLVIVIGDKYVKGEWIPLGFQTMNEIVQRGFLLKSIVVKNFETTTGKRHQRELWKYRALVGGFYVFKHEYIFVFQKRP